MIMLMQINQSLGESCQSLQPGLSDSGQLQFERMGLLSETGVYLRQWVYLRQVRQGFALLLRPVFVAPVHRYVSKAQKRKKSILPGSQPSVWSSPMLLAVGLCLVLALVSPQELFSVQDATRTSKRPKLL